MLSDDVTNLGRDLFIKANEFDRTDPMHTYLMKVAGRIQTYRNLVLQLERTVVPANARNPVVIDLTDDKVVPFPGFKRPIPTDGGAA